MSRQEQVAIAAALPAVKTSTEARFPMLYDRNEAAARLSVSLRTLDEQIALGNISVVRIGRTVRFRPAALEAFIEANETKLSARRRAAIRGKKRN
jgi:excisionase family DNA binding protein